MKLLSVSSKVLIARAAGKESIDSAANSAVRGGLKVVGRGSCAAVHRNRGRDSTVVAIVTAIPSKFIMSGWKS